MPRKYVKYLFIHVSGVIIFVSTLGLLYSPRRVVQIVAKTVCAKYKYIRRQAPLLINTLSSLDSLFYLLTESLYL
jgi:hypothetical protein